MRRSLLSLTVVAALVVLGMTTAFAQTVNVTFLINTATAPDTINANSLVTVTGNKAALTTFGNGDTATSIGGDYWTVTVGVTQGDTLSYKFRVNGGWENNSTNADGIGSITDNRTMIVGASDTTLPLQYVNFTGNTQPQYWKPWTAVADTFINVFFRVDMQGFAGFNATTDTVGVRGDQKDGHPSWGSAYFSWGTSAYLTKESNSGLSYDGSNFWSGRVTLEKSKVSPGDTAGYKFIVNNDWGKSDFDNRYFTVPFGNDTTLHWVWFQNAPVIARANPDSVVVTFRADMTTAKQKGSFSDGDTVYVEVGYFSTADSTRRTVPLQKQGLSNFYQGTLTMHSKIGLPLDYQYYRTKNASDVRENYYNFSYTGGNNSEQEKRQVVVPTGTNFTVRDTVVSIDNDRRQPYFANQRNLSQNVAVKWVVDMRPAYYQIWAGDTIHGIQGTINVTNADSIKPWGVCINGPATGGWASAWNAELVADSASKTKMWDDGTHGDATANDTMYTITLNYKTTDVLGQVFKFGIRGGDNEAGAAAGFGLNHLENIDDTNPTFTIVSQFGSINPNYYNAWDYNQEKPAPPTGVYTPLKGVPLTYDLYQNYPNPFNPTTTIVYDLPMESNVGLKVYNLLGQVVANLADGKQQAGRHIVTFDASRLTSGVYFYQITAGNFVSVKKMVLVK
jgi:Secretion system C-terminal sorting domain